MSVACRAESLCPQYVTPRIADVAHAGDDWVVLYQWDTAIDPAFGVYVTNASYLVSRDDGATWAEPEWEGPSSGGGYGPYNHFGGFAVPMELFLSGGEFYQVVPYERDDRGNYQLQIWRLDLDEARIVRTATTFIPRVVTDGDLLVYYHAGSSTEYYAIDPTTGDTPSFVTEVWTRPAMHLPVSPDVWARTNRERTPLRLIGFTTDQWNVSSPLLRCVLSSTPPTPLHPNLACVPDAEWPPAAGGGVFQTFADGEPRGFAGGLWTEGTGADERTRALTLGGGPDDGRLTTYDVGPGRLVMRRADTYGGPYVDDARHRFGDLVALSREIEDGSRRTTLYRFTSASAFDATTLPTRPCPDGVECGYRPEGFLGGFSDSVLQWAEPLARDEYRMFYVVDAATPTHNHLVMLTSVERLDRGPATAGSALERACALEQACLFGVSDDIQQCVWSWLNPAEVSEAALARFVAADTCEEIFAADPGHAVAFGSPCAGEPLECRGALALSCSGGTVLGVAADCSRHGGTCALRPDGNVSCAPASVDCATSAGTCDAAGRAILCTAEGVYDCPAAGMTCELSPTGFPGCVLRTAACTEPATSVCDGDRVVSCTNVGVGIVAMDCARAGLPCASVGGYAECADGRGACDGTVAARCDGSTLVYCFGTTLRSVDCASLGMTCGTDGASRTRCVSSAAPDAGVPVPDAGPPACGSAALTGPTVSENAIADYPTATGGVIADGTYILTQFDVWSSTPQPYTHQETLVFSGGTLETVELHSAIGLTSSSGSYSTLDVMLGYEASCPFTRSSTWRYSVTATGLVVLDSSFIRTYTRL